MQTFNEKAVIGRIKQLRNRYAGARGKSQFARDLGISASTYSYYEKDRIAPIDILVKMCEITGADLQWLITGQKDEENFAYGPSGGLLRKLDSVLDERPDLAEPISAFIDLLDEKKGFEKKLHSATRQTSPGRPGWIPVLGRTAVGLVHFWDQEVLPESGQAVTELDELVEKHIGKKIIGSANAAISADLQAPAVIDSIKKAHANLVQVGGEEADTIVEFVECEEIYEMFADSFALRIDGDSMSPRINDGDIVVLSPSVPAAQGQIGVARLANQIGVTCKLIRTEKAVVHLIPINERYETKIVGTKDLLWSLAVLCHISF